MKTIKKYTIGLFAVAVALLCSCTNESDEPNLNDDELRIIGLSIASCEMTTRADASPWTDGDEIQLTVGKFSGEAKYYFKDENNKGWNILNADGSTVNDGIVFTKQEMDAGISVRASYSKPNVDAAYNDELLADNTEGAKIGTVNFISRNDNLAAFTLAIGLAHTKSHITVNLTNNITGDEVQNLQVVLLNADGTTSDVAMKTNTENTSFECFAKAASIEKFVVSMLGSDEKTYKIEVYPLYGADNKGFAIETNHRYPFKITLTPSNQTRAFGNAAKGYGVITLEK